MRPVSAEPREPELGGTWDRLRGHAATLSDRLRGHAATLGPFFSRTLSPPVRPDTLPWSTTLTDPDVGSVGLSGRALVRKSKTALLVVHGLGGSAESGYMAGPLCEADRRGITCLLLSTRGSDRSGQDFAHAGLWSDIHAALDSELFADIEAVDLLGYSLGGHLVMSFAAASVHPKLRRVAAVGAPLLLDPIATSLDAARLNVYRTHVMKSLHEIYTVAYQRNPRGIVPEEARRIRRFREWDERVIAPRFGFAGAVDYYRKVSVGPKLGEIKVDALYVGATHDPMVPPSSVLPALAQTRFDVVWDPSAGHLGFGPKFDLGLAAPLGLEPQVMAWLAGDARRDAPR